MQLSLIQLSLSTATLSAAKLLPGQPTGPKLPRGSARLPAQLLAAAARLPAQLPAWLPLSAFYRAGGEFCCWLFASLLEPTSNGSCLSVDLTRWMLDTYSF